MTQAPPKPVLFEGELLELWTAAQFQVTSKLQDNGHLFEEALLDPSKWPNVLRGMPKKSNRFEKSCDAVGRHIGDIQVFIDVTSATFQLVAQAVPVVTPATICVQAFALAFRAFVAVYEELERIETFFEDMKQLFKELSIMSQYLRGDRKLGVLRDSVTEIFSCSLKVCASAIEDHDGRFKKWLKHLKGDTELDRLLSDMQSAKERLIRCVSWATYTEMTRMGHSLEAIEKRGTQEDRNDILDWLSRLDFETRHAELRDQVKGRPNAGRWLLDSAPFQKWKHTRCSRLWYTGKPGAGKSVLASIIIRHLNNTMVATKDKDEPVVAILYMSHKNKPELAQLLGTIMRQIVADMPFVPDEVEVEWRKITGRGKTDGSYLPASKDTLQTMLKTMTAGRTFYIVLDALDECMLEIRRPLLNALKDICQDVRILVTARRFEQRDELSRGFDHSWISAQKQDVVEYIESVIREDPELRKCSSDKIKQQVGRKAGEMFLLVRLHMHALCNRGGPQEINFALEKLPDTVDGCYANAIIRVHMKDSPREILACATLAWMSYACRPLKFPELRHAIAAQMSDSGSSIKREKLYDQERVTSVCCGLVEIDADDYVRFVHYSAEDYFRQRKESHFGNSRIEIPLACAKYLCMDVLKKPVRSTDSEESIEHRAHSEQLQAYPFAQYAAEHLHTHFKLVRNKNDRTEKQVELDQYIHQLVSEEPTREFYCRLLQDLQAYYTRSTVLEGDYSYGEVDATPLHLAVFLGRCDLVRSLLDRPSTNANEIDGYKQTPLVVAFKKDFGDIAEILLDHGATVDLSTRQGHVLLEYAAQRDYKKAVGKILATVKQTEQTQHLWSLFDLGVLLCSPLILILCLLGKMLMKSDGWVIPTQFPGENGTLVPDGKRSDHLLERYGRVLTLAYEGRSRELDEFIAIHPFDVDDCDQEDQVSTRSVSSSSECDDMGAQDFLTTACFLAVEGDHTSTVAVLLSRGVSANLTNFHGQPLLHRATFRKNIGLLELLLNGGADVNLQDNHERTAYTAHASIKHKAALRFLKSKGANIHHTNGDGVHELYRAAAFGNKEMVEFFLDAGVSACIANVYSWTPLHEASANRHLRCVRLLLDRGARGHLSPISDVGKTPLDLVKSEQLHYDWPCLGEDSEHYLNGEVYKEKEQDLRDIDCGEEIKRLLIDEGAKTADELYAEDRSLFSHVSARFHPSEE